MRPPVNDMCTRATPAAVSTVTTAVGSPSAKPTTWDTSATTTGPDRVTVSPLETTPTISAVDTSARKAGPRSPQLGRATPGAEVAPARLLR
jgi:hypothetical protein